MSLLSDNDSVPHVFRHGYAGGNLLRDCAGPKLTAIILT
jgi:hypothetical protein